MKSYTYGYIYIIRINLYHSINNFFLSQKDIEFL